MLHCTRHLLTSVINAIRAHLAEFGITAAVGRRGLKELLRVVADASDKRVPELVRSCLAASGQPIARPQSPCQSGAVHTWHWADQPACPRSRRVKRSSLGSGDSSATRLAR
jgi:hypothetical protein